MTARAPLRACEMRGKMTGDMREKRNKEREKYERSVREVRESEEKFSTCMPATSRSSSPLTNGAASTSSPVLQL